MASFGNVYASFLSDCDHFPSDVCVVIRVVFFWLGFISGMWIGHTWIWCLCVTSFRLYLTQHTLGKKDLSMAASITYIC